MGRSLKIIEIFAKMVERLGGLPHDLLDGINLAEVHCIDRIGTINHANVTKVAKEMGMTRGAISKISKKLLGKGFIESYQRSDNNKEIYFRLTEVGRIVYGEHEKRHREVRQEELSLLKTYSNEEQAAILRFLNDINHLIDNVLSDEIEKK